MFRHLKATLCTLLQRDYIPSVLSHIELCVQASKQHNSPSLLCVQASKQHNSPSLLCVVDELQAAARSLFTLFSLVQVRALPRPDP